MFLLVFTFPIVLTILFITQLRRKHKENVLIWSRLCIELLIGFLIIESNFGNKWEISREKITTQYKYGSGVSVNCTLTITLSLRGGHIDLSNLSSLREDGLHLDSDTFYTHFEWSNNSEYFIDTQLLKAKRMGYPKPVVWTIDYFASKEEHYQYSEFYRLSSNLCIACLWSALYFYVTSLLFLKFDLTMGAYWIGISGLFQLLANLLWFLIQNPIPVQLYFDSGELNLHFGVTFWMNFSTGCFCLISTILIICIPYKYKRALYKWFGCEPNCPEDVFIDSNKDEHYYVIYKRPGNTELRRT